MDLLKEIGAILGFVAFGGLAVLAFLTFQQARHVRRLRDWAGRSPERDAIEAERVAEAAQEATIARAGSRVAAAEEHDQDFDEPEEKGPGLLDRMRGEAAYRWEELDRRSPVDPKILVAALLAVIVGLAVITSGFGLLGGDSDEPATTVESDGGNGGGKKEDKPDKEEEPTGTEVAVLNGTAPEGGVGVPGVADAAKVFVEDAGFTVGEVTDAPTSFTVSVVMYNDGFEEDAATLAGELESQLGTTETLAMDPSVQAVIGSANLALVVGQDDQAIATP